MRITYDKQADAAYIYLVPTIAPGTVKRTIPCGASEIGTHINFDLDDSGKILGIEIIDAATRLPKDTLNRANII